MGKMRNTTENGLILDVCQDVRGDAGDRDLRPVEDVNGGLPI